MADIWTGLVPSAALPVAALLDVSPSLDVPLPLALLPALRLAPTLPISPALAPLRLGHGHRRLFPRMPELVEVPSAGLGAPRTPTRLGGQ